MQPLSQVVKWKGSVELSEVLILCHILECTQLIYFLHVHLLMSFQGTTPNPQVLVFFLKKKNNLPNELIY